MSWVLGLVKLLPSLLSFGRELLQRMDEAKAREVIREGKERVKDFQQAYDDDPLSATRDFWDDGVQSDSSDTGSGSE